MSFIGKVKWFWKWKVIKFPREVKNYGLKYAFEKEYIDPWWYPLKYGVINLVKWFPVIWKDRDWDYHFWIRLNLKKLRGMEKSIRNGHHVRCEEDADNIHKAILALERLEADDYILDVNKWHDKKYGELKMDSVPCDVDGNDLPEGEKPTLYRCDFSTTKWDELTESEKKLSDFLRSKNYKRADYLKKQDLEYVTKIINKYLFHWWD